MDERIGHRAWSGVRGGPIATTLGSVANLDEDPIASGFGPGSWLPPASPDDVEAALRAQGYLPGDGLSTAIFLAIELRRPLVPRGRAGGRQDRGRQRPRPLVRVPAPPAPVLRGHRRPPGHLRVGLPAPAALPPGPRPGPGHPAGRRGRALLRAFLDPPTAAAGDRREHAWPVRPRRSCSIDEIDRADDEFEAFLLEILADFTVTVPEVGTFRAEVPPVVVLTSNRTRDVHDALKRRALYHWVEHPDFDREVSRSCCRGSPRPVSSWPVRSRSAVQALRAMGLYKSPGVAEAIDWAAGAARARARRARRGERGPHSRRGAQVPRGRRARPRRTRTTGRSGDRQWLTWSWSTTSTRPARSSRSAVRSARRGSASRCRTCSPTCTRSACSGCAAPAACTGPDGRPWCGGPRTSRHTTGCSPPFGRVMSRGRPSRSSAIRGLQGPAHQRRRRVLGGRGGGPRRAALQQRRGPSRQGLRRLQPRRAGRSHREHAGALGHGRRAIVASLAGGAPG